MQGGSPVTHLHRGGGGKLVSPLSCSSQRYSNLSLIWSEMAFSTVLACRVGQIFTTILLGVRLTEERFIIKSGLSERVRLTSI